MNKCYYDDPDHCQGELWQCLTCSEWYCEYHWHVTDRGSCIECVACENAREEIAESPLPNPLAGFTDLPLREFRRMYEGDFEHFNPDPDYDAHVENGAIDDYLEV